MFAGGEREGGPTTKGAGGGGGGGGGTPRGRFRPGLGSFGGLFFPGILVLGFGDWVAAATGPQNLGPISGFFSPGKFGRGGLRTKGLFAKLGGRGQGGTLPGLDPGGSQGGRSRRANFGRPNFFFTPPPATARAERKNVFWGFLGQKRKKKQGQGVFNG